MLPSAGGVFEASHLRWDARPASRAKSRLTLMKTTLSVNGPPSPPRNTGSSFRRYASRLFVLGTRSRIKSGMTTNESIPKRLDSVIPTKLLVGISMLLLHGSPLQTENRSTVNQVLLLFPTRNSEPRPFAFSYNLQHGTCN